VERLDIGELADVVLVEPGEERAHGPVISHAGVVVLDRCHEKFEEAARRPGAGIRDHRWDGQRTVQRRFRNCARRVDHSRQLLPIAAHRDAS
jgi:hypothetical protein